MSNPFCVETPVDLLGTGVDLFALTGKTYPALAELAFSTSRRKQSELLERLVTTKRFGSVVACFVLHAEQAHIAIFTPSGNSLYFCFPVDKEKLSPKARDWWDFATRHYSWICFDLKTKLHLLRLRIFASLCACTEKTDSIAACLEAFCAAAESGAEENLVIVDDFSVMQSLGLSTEA